MFISKVRIRNFRVFGDEGVEFIFNKGVNAIIGENNSGKSALIDAIRIAFSFTQYSNKDIYFTKNDFHIDSEGNRASTASIDVYLSDVPEYLIDIWNPRDGNEGEFHLKFYTVPTQSGTEKVKGLIWGGESEGNALSSDSFDSVHVSFLNALRDAENEMRPSRTSRLAKLLENIVPDAATRNAFVDVVSNANKQIMQMEHIGKAKGSINANLQNIEQDLLQQHVDIGFIEPRFESVIAALKSWVLPRWRFIRSDNACFGEIEKSCPRTERFSFIRYSNCGLYIDVAKAIDYDGFCGDVKNTLSSYLINSFELYQNGLGYNNIIFMSTVLGDISSFNDKITLNLLLVEEPEAHLHPQLQELIHSFFYKKCEDKKTIQVVYTSHSPTLVSRIGIGGINLLYEADFTIKCFPLSNSPLDETDKLYLEKYLDVTKSQLFFC